LDLEQLRTFLALADTKSYSKTAGRLFVTQSTISKRIVELEKEVGEVLFIRERSGSTLTKAGSAMYEYAERIVNTEATMRLRVQEQGHYRGRLVIATVYAYYDPTLVDVLRRYMEARPSISVQVRFGHTNAIRNEIGQAVADIAFTHHPTEHPDITCRLVDEDQIVLVADGLNTAYPNGIPHELIRELPMVYSHFLYDTTREWLFPKGWQFAMEVGIAKNTVPLIIGSHWYTLLAKRLVEAELASGRLRSIPILGASPPPVRYYMSYRNESTREVAVQDWIAFYGAERPTATS